MSEMKMWRILKTELSYNRSITFVANTYCLIMLLAVWFGALRSNRPPLIMLVLLTSVFLASYSGAEKRIEQKRERLQTLCPLPIWQIGLMKSVYPLAIWINMLALYISMFLLLSVFKTLTIVPPFHMSWMTGPSFNQMLTLNGWILIISSLYHVARDLRFSTRGWRLISLRIFQVFLSFAAILPFFIITNFLGAFGENSLLAGSLSRFSFSPSGYLGFNILGVSLFLFSVFVFCRRRSYAKS